MNNVKIGKLIYNLRKEKNLTQVQLAERMNISDKTVSKWERGFGCPEVSLLPELSTILDVDLENLLSGELDRNEILGGSMKKLQFYICPACGNMVTAITDTNMSCCGKKMKALKPQKANENEKLTVETVENDFYITSDHPMERGHYIAFIALLTGDSILLKKQYPEWDLQVRIPVLAHGRLLWYCNKHGLFYMEI
ncbi:helix-turn-helix domain-containing protein [Lachnospiraceae bacterium ASD3451]|uniref:helix-turn-helix domain-containing protein n=1 Tax=Diplocloster agilis TaxID=2850323 RepID=UPI001D9FE7F8|nr:helix-turn-helix domain-containing protein [Diplocloster agilis]MBU9744211.1 helix-turn-helix domain-containing protein [Diplocloster agilis]